VRLDDIASSSEVPVLPVQGWISTGVGVWCVPRHLVVPIHFHLTEHPLPPRKRTTFS